MAHIHSIILYITRSKNNEVVEDFDIITNWDLTILCPRVVKRTAAGCMARERTKGLLFTYHLRWGIVLNYFWRRCKWKKIIISPQKGCLEESVSSIIFLPYLFNHPSVQSQVSFFVFVFNVVSLSFIYNFVRYLCTK